MSQLLKTPTLVYQLMNLCTEENVQIFVFAYDPLETKF